MGGCSRRVVARLPIVLAGLSVLAACGPIQVGTAAVSQRDGRLVVAVMRCDGTPLERVEVSHAGPLVSGGPRTWTTDARWTTDQDDRDIIVLDTGLPGRGWDVAARLTALDPETRYTASAGGDGDHTMGSVGFTAGELATLPAGQWLTSDSRPDPAAGARPTVTDLAALRSDFCG